MTVYRNATIIRLHPPEIRRNADFTVEDGLITSVGKGLNHRHKTAKIVDLKEAIVMPGLICAHTHLYSVLTRGITADLPPSRDFVSILQNLWWRLDKAVDEEILYSSGLIGALEAIKTGTTSIVDHNASPSFITGSLDILRKALEDIGVRGILCYEATDRNGLNGMESGVHENIRFAESIGKSDEGRLVEAAVGAHAPFTLSDETLKLLRDAVRNTGRGLHLHIAEDAYDVSHSHHLYGLDIAKRLDRFGLLDEKTICAHGAHLSDDDIRILNHRQSFLIHNPRSNMNNQVGYAGKARFVGYQALGTDGIGANMFEEAKIAYFKAQDAGLNVAPGEVVRILQSGNTLLERYFDAQFGEITDGCRADFIVLDYDCPTPLKEENIAGHFIFGMSSRDVRSVCINGVPVYVDRRFSFDVTDFYRQARISAEKLWNNM